MKPFDGRVFIRDLMGRRVIYRQAFRRCRFENKRWWEVADLPEPLTGWAVGATYLQHGKRYDGQGGYDYFGEADYDPPGFEETAPRTLAYLVTPWPTHRPHHVPPWAVEVLTSDVTPSALPEAERKLLKEHSRRFPRNEKGQFISGPLLPSPSARRVTREEQQEYLKQHPMEWDHESEPHTIPSPKEGDGDEE